MCDNTKNGRTLAPNHEKAKPPRKKIPHACKRGQKVGRGVGVSQLKNIPPTPSPLLSGYASGRAVGYRLRSACGRGCVLCPVTGK